VLHTLHPQNKNSIQKVVAIEDAMAQVLWTRHFLVVQVEYVPTMTIYQDNKSTIKLAENGKQSSSRWTRHLNIRYFFVTDKIKKGEVKVAFCPTHDMLADFSPSHFKERYSQECVTRY